MGLSGRIVEEPDLQTKGRPGKKNKKQNRPPIRTKRMRIQSLFRRHLLRVLIQQLLKFLSLEIEFQTAEIFSEHFLHLKFKNWQFLIASGKCLS